MTVPELFLTNLYKCQKIENKIILYCVSTSQRSKFNPTSCLLKKLINGKYLNSFIQISSWCNQIACSSLNKLYNTSTLRLIATQMTATGYIEHILELNQEK